MAPSCPSCGRRLTLKVDAEPNPRADDRPLDERGPCGERWGVGLTPQRGFPSRVALLPQEFSMLRTSRALSAAALLGLLPVFAACSSSQSSVASSASTASTAPLPVSDAAGVPSTSGLVVS